jgi:hypothetical protein
MEKMMLRSTTKVYLGRLALGQKILPLVEIGFALEREKGAVLELVAADCHLNAEQLLKDHQLVAGVYITSMEERCEVSSVQGLTLASGRSGAHVQQMIAEGLRERVGEGLGISHAIGELCGERGQVLVPRRWPHRIHQRPVTEPAAGAHKARRQVS